jgi:hypothetical protein
MDQQRPLVLDRHGQQVVRIELAMPTRGRGGAFLEIFLPGNSLVDDGDEAITRQVGAAPWLNLR